MINCKGRGGRGGEIFPFFKEGMTCKMSDGGEVPIYWIILIGGGIFWFVQGAVFFVALENLFSVFCGFYTACR